MIQYIICNRANEEIFNKQHRALMGHIPGIHVTEKLEDVDGSIFIKYRFNRGTIKLDMSMQTNDIIVTSDVPISEYFD